MHHSTFYFLFKAFMVCAVEPAKLKESCFSSQVLMHLKILGHGLEW